MSGKKTINTFFIGCLYDDYKIKPIHLMLPKTSKKVMIVKLNGCIFLVEDDDLLENNNTIWDEVNFDIKKEIDTKAIYKKYFLKAKIKFYGDEAKHAFVKKCLKLASILA